MKRGYKSAYPWFNAAFEAWLLVYNVAYLFERTAYYRPWLSWVGVDLRRVSQVTPRGSNMTYLVWFSQTWPTITKRRNEGNVAKIGRIVMSIFRRDVVKKVFQS